MCVSCILYFCVYILYVLCVYFICFVCENVKAESCHQISAVDVELLTSVKHVKFNVQFCFSSVFCSFVSDTPYRVSWCYVVCVCVCVCM